MKTSKKIKYNYTKEFKQIVEKINEFKKIENCTNIPMITNQKYNSTIKKAYILSMKTCCLDLLNACEEWLNAGGHIVKPGEGEV